MPTMVAKLKQRFISELPLWHLSYWQFLLLLLWAGWPWLAQWAFPNNAYLGLGPVIIFLPIAYVVGGMFEAVLPGFAPAFGLGISFTIFALAYLALVSWRQGRVRLKRPVVQLIPFVAFIIVLVILYSLYRFANAL